MIEVTVREVDTDSKSFATMEFGCTYCSKPIVRTFNITNMCEEVRCNYCGRQSINVGIVTTDVDKRIEKHVVC